MFMFFMFIAYVALSILMHTFFCLVIVLLCLWCKQKVALDKIAERIHDIWGKMEDAAVRSTDIITPLKSPDKDGAYLSQIEGEFADNVGS